MSESSDVTQAGAPAVESEVPLEANAQAESAAGDAEAPDPEAGKVDADLDALVELGADSEASGSDVGPESPSQAGSGLESQARSAAKVVERTGDERVDAALARLADLDELPLAAQVTVFDDVHRLLQDALTASDASPTAGVPAR